MLKLRAPNDVQTNGAERRLVLESLRERVEWNDRHARINGGQTVGNKKLSYRRGTVRCILSIEIMPTATQQCRNYLYDKS